MHDEQVDDVMITERINGWWVSVRYGSGHEEHHGPYLDQDSAVSEAELLQATPTRIPDDA